MLTRVDASMFYVALLCLSFKLPSAASFMSNEFSSTRYFTDKGILPPLQGLGIAPLNGTMELDYDYNTHTSSVLSLRQGPSVPVTYTNNPKSVYRWLADNLPYEGCTLGFDVESVPRLRRKKDRSPFDNAATIQLATTDSCLVIHLARRSGKHSMACAPILKAVLNDEQFVKAGCALDEDLVSLYELWGDLDARSRLDLGLLGSQSTGHRQGLKSLSKSLLGLDLPKPVNVAISDWSTVPLSDSQVVYSARDAWAGAAIAHKLAEHDPETFGHEALVDILRESEPPIAELVAKQRQRSQAKRELRSLVGPFKSRKLPEDVKLQVKTLRQQIKSPVMAPHLVFEVDHLLGGYPHA
eukprot:CAMPEP_0176083814 /NCGR_PEP_ID=MMETSP0120_2-20121206/41939_1 /TAXON_ID=160619 /ORGANISM="Kryptoperidinium foliaceum, Strain CCMP 1326" /LENGTH=353 /DNA_ID=CAMNT_0017417611 /DNA_START=192 /DNA_END=1253 /DNA_ORIENTATION=-